MTYYQDLSPILKDAREAAALAGEHIRSVRSSGNLGLKQKGEIDFVTEADLGAERIILEFLHARYPEHRFLAEESIPQLASPEFAGGPLWIIDPVDGTTNFSRGFNHTAVSIGFYQEGAPAVGVVYAPFLGETYWASKGSGAYLNDRRLSVSMPVSLKQTLVATGFPYARDDVAPIMTRLHRVLEQCQDIRRMGSAALDICAVASGLIDAYYEDVAPWDMAGGLCIALEAGAKVGHYLPAKEAGNPFLRSENLLVASPAIFDQFAQLLVGEV